MFYENENFIIGAVIGLVVGAVVMWIYRHFSEPKMLKEEVAVYQMRLSVIPDLKAKISSQEDEIMWLKGEIQEIKEINPNIENQKKQLTEAKIRTNEQHTRYKYLAKIVGKLELKRIVVEVREEQATNKAEKDAKKAKNNAVDPDVAALSDKSKSISSTKPKNTPNQ